MPAPATRSTTHVVGPLLDRGNAAGAVRQPLPTLVERHDSRECGEQTQEFHVLGKLVQIFDVVDDAGDEDEMLRSPLWA